MNMSESNLSVVMKKMSSELRLVGVHHSIDRLAAIAVKDALHPLEYLQLVLDEEKRHRKESSARTLKTRAKFRSDAELEDWDHDFPRGLTKAQFKECASLRFHTNRENLLILGSTGMGKTHLAIALGKKLCSENIRVQFYSVNFLFEEAHTEKISGKYLQFIKKIRSASVIILDDFGLRTYTHEEAQILIDILEERYLKGSIIITSQVDINGWGKLFADPVISEAIIDRLSQPSQRVVIKGVKSYREKARAKKEVDPIQTLM
jgi:DNA replication protein DnaC